MLTGTRIFKRSRASRKFSTSPTHSSRDPAGRTTELATFFWASRTALPTSRPRTLNFNRDIALLLFAVNKGGACSELDFGDLTERHLNLAIRPLRANGDVANGVEILPVARGKTHPHRKMPVAAFLIEIAGGLAADRGLNDRIDVARHEPVARRLAAIDVDRHCWLTK